MAAKRRSSGPRSSRLQTGTDYRSRGGRVTYYRDGRDRSASAGGYRAARYQGEYHLAGPRGNQVAFRPPARTYHRVVLAEFIACITMVAASIVLVPAQGTEEGAGTAARSFAKELVQLTAICIVFFILALAASGEKTGKPAAAFGGLVTLGVAWNTSGIFSGLAKAFGPPKTAQGGAGG